MSGRPSFWKRHIVDSTAQLVPFTPMLAAAELFLAGMPAATSADARLISIASIYLGLGSAYTIGRDWLKKRRNITDTTSEVKQQLNDVIYTAAGSGLMAPASYIYLGSTDLEQIAIGTVAATGIGGVTGAFSGYAIDTFGDMTGLKPCKRKTYPSFIRRQSLRVKRAVAATIVAASIGLTGIIYQQAEQIQQPTYQPSSQKQENK